LGSVDNRAVKFKLRFETKNLLAKYSADWYRSRHFQNDLVHIKKIFY